MKEQDLLRYKISKIASSEKIDKNNFKQYTILKILR